MKKNIISLFSCLILISSCNDRNNTSNIPVTFNLPSAESYSITSFTCTKINETKSYKTDANSDNYLFSIYSNILKAIDNGKYYLIDDSYTCSEEITCDLFNTYDTLLFTFKTGTLNIHYYGLVSKDNTIDSYKDLYGKYRFEIYNCVSDYSSPLIEIDTKKYDTSSSKLNVVFEDKSYDDSIQLAMNSMYQSL